MKCPSCGNPLTEKETEFWVCLTCDSMYSEEFVINYWDGLSNEKKNKPLHSTSE